jgi:hypothetical protein
MSKLLQKNMNLTFSELLENIKIVGSRIFEANGYEFQRGFNTCYVFFEEQLKKTTLYNQSYLIDQLKELEKVNNKMLDVSKVAFVGGMVIDNERTKELESKNKNLENQILQLKQLLSRQKEEIIQISSQMKFAQPKNQNNLKVDKKYKKAMDFIAYYGLEEPFKDFNSSFLEEKLA